ncbi:hypothetical protein DPMN_033699 [Dreissena polymorpha]|uniref:Uncharacterized protein n=1 Tax=Dreissena polymorpha TaxID=45954 RepID=A0A9D4RJ24_DREPO|nr:hypothetical protein DPMN_033699 [Dreissena polymorpha]
MIPIIIIIIDNFHSSLGSPITTAAAADHRYHRFLPNNAIAIISNIHITLIVGISGIIITLIISVLPMLIMKVIVSFHQQ